MKALLGILLGALCSVSAAGSEPATPELPLPQLNHRAYTSAQGAPTNIFALAQTSDGTLWAGGGAGLTRFDGIRFAPYPGPSEEALPSLNISTLLAAPDGGLWIGFRLGGASYLKNGRLTNYGERDGLPDGTVIRLAWDHDGSLWAVTPEGLAHFNGKRWVRVADDSLGSPTSVMVDRAGTLWVATVDGLFARPARESHFHEIRRTEFNRNASGAILTTSPDGRVWAGAFHELIRVDRPTDPRSAAPVVLHGISGGPLVFDDEGNLWASDGNLLRARFLDLTRDNKPDVDLSPEKFSSADGMTSGEVLAILKDRERNIWAGTSKGLDRFSYSNVVRSPQLCSQAGINPFAPGDAGAVWVACPRQSFIAEVREGTVVSRLSTQAFTAAYRDPQGTVWFGGANAIAHLEDGGLVTTSLPQGALSHDAQALVRDARGAMWVSVAGRGIYRLFEGKWSDSGGLTTLPRGPAFVESAGQNGVLWFGYRKNKVARVDGQRVLVFDDTNGLEIGNVLAVLADRDQVWVGGEFGVARLSGDRFVSIHPAAGPPFKGISGIVRARDGDIWLNGIGGITRVARGEIEQVKSDPTHHVECETLDYLDGVPGIAVQMRPQPSAMESSDGHLWFSLTAGFISIDPTRMVRNTLPPPVTVWSVSSEQRVYPNRGAVLRLPAHTTNLQIAYGAGSLTVPERVRFRYKLEGSDRDWQDVGALREAIYTNLRPGDYTFKVVASNNDGVWNNTGASIRFAILPAFYQTTWFYVLCALASLGFLGALYRVRMHQVATQVRARLEARLAERERIARELHDTLLQGMQGLIWRFQAATDRIPADEPSRELMEQSLDRADKLLCESRDRVKDLRPAATDPVELAQALAAEGQQFAQLHPSAFRVSVQGACRNLHPIVREEGFLIAREALTNAFHHANAREIEAEVTYSDTALHVRVRDDGRGFGADIREAGAKQGHFGLAGMRERASKLGAHLEIWSKPGSGTEVDLQIPAHVAYRPSKRGQHASVLDAIWPGFRRRDRPRGAT